MILQVRFVTYDHQHYIIQVEVLILEQYFTCQSHPRLYVKVRLGIGHIVHDKDPRSAFVVNFAQRFVSLLSSGIPKGNFDVLVSDLYDFR